MLRSCFRSSSSTRPRWHSHVRQALQQRAQVTLAELLASQPLQQGLAELVAYLSLAAERWQGGDRRRRARSECWTVAGATAGRPQDCAACRA